MISDNIMTPAGPSTIVTSPLCRAAFVHFVFLVISGCQNEQDRIYPIAGRVVFADGSPARFGIIEFRSESPEPIIARGEIQKDGTFNVRAAGKSWGLTRGTHQAIILQVIGNPRGQPRLVHNHGLEVADKYRSYQTSDLRIEVTPESENEFELVVDSKIKQ